MEPCARSVGRRLIPTHRPRRRPATERQAHIALAVAAVALMGVGAFLAVMLRTDTPAVAPPPLWSRTRSRRATPTGSRHRSAIRPRSRSIRSGAESAAMLSTEEIVTRSMPAVVTVVARDGFGSGFFVSSDTVITNAHVIDGNEVVTLLRGSSYSRTARVQSVSHEIDLAVLKLDIADFDQVVLALADPHDVTIGSDVVAIGSPRGLANTVTRGIVSAVREVNNVNMVQTDAAINPGNSGGPLLDRRGRVLGVNTMKLGRGTEGMAFAVSIRYIPRMIGTSYTPKSERDERREKGMRDTPRTCARSRSAPTRWTPTGSRSGRHARSRTVSSPSTSGSRCRTAGACRCVIRPVVARGTATSRSRPSRRATRSSATRRRPDRWGSSPRRRGPPAAA